MGMRIRNCQLKSPRVAAGAFSLVEVCFAMALAGMMMTTLYAGLAYGFSVMRLARENTRATQILIERMETIRLYTWEQINTTGFIPASFQVYYNPMGGSTNRGTVYTGTVQIAAAPIGTSYAGDMKKVSFTLNWKTGNLNRTRSISTYVSHYGLQNYIYY
jgi:uncharacterized protein (TIGR02598 family)